MAYRVTPSFWAGKRVFVTGHTGFKGMWLCRMLAVLGAETAGYALDAPTVEGEELLRMPGMNACRRSIYGDVRNLDALEKAVRGWQPEIVFHLAAQPIVSEGYRNPEGTYSTNVMGTVNLLECVRQTDTVKSVVNVTTDKVYRNREWVWGYRERDDLDGFDPYASSKSCSELVTRCYRRSFFADGRVAISTARAGNVIGGGDFAHNRIVPDCIRAAAQGKPIGVRNPHSVRPYQHVLDPLYAYLLIAEMQHRDIKFADSYNVGPTESDCVTTGELASMFSEIWGDGQAWEAVEREMPPESNTLRLDCAHLRSVFGWSPQWNIHRALKKTIEWAKIYFSQGDVALCMDHQIEEFLSGGKAHEEAGDA
ncbi:MAG: CDP-glucose 4,6-dehydratase [Selenomonadaceae bacterium]|nr:CDP-glucose 4,6-dehydratase [Selenomonadaceae bacterium]